MFVVLLNDWQVALFVAKLLVVRHEIERIIEYLSEDPVLTEKVIEAKSVFYLNDIKVISMINISRLVWSLDLWNTCECLIVLTDEFATDFYILACPPEL